MRIGKVLLALLLATLVAGVTATHRRQDPGQSYRLPQPAGGIQHAFWRSNFATVAAMAGGVDAIVVGTPVRALPGRVVQLAGGAPPSDFNRFSSR